MYSILDNISNRAVIKCPFSLGWWGNPSQELQTEVAEPCGVGVVEASKHQKEYGWDYLPRPFQLDGPWLVEGLVSLLPADPTPGPEKTAGWYRATCLKAKDRDWDIQGLKKSAGNLLISLPYSSASRLSPCSYSKAEEVKWDSWLQVTLEVLALITVLVCIEHLVQRSGSFLELSWEGVDIWVESQSENWATALDATESLPILHSLQ